MAEFYVSTREARHAGNILWDPEAARLQARWALGYRLAVGLLWQTTRKRCRHV
jgi:hypothetical protein